MARVSDALSAAVKAAEKAREGDSNDDEIEALWDALDLALAEIESLPESWED